MIPDERINEIMEPIRERALKKTYTEIDERIHNREALAEVVVPALSVSADIKKVLARLSVPKIRRSLQFIPGNGDSSPSFM